MTLRALSIQYAKEGGRVSGTPSIDTQRNTDNKLVKLAGKAVVHSNQQKMAQALDDQVTADLAKEVVEAVANHVASIGNTIEDVSIPEKKKLATLASALRVSGSDVEEELFDNDDEEEVHSFVMEDLAKAVAEGDDDGVDRAILKTFLEEHAPARLDELEELLDKYQGQEMDVLFKELVAKYPDPASAEQQGERNAISNILEDKTVEDNEEDVQEEVQEDIGIIEGERRKAAQAEREEKTKIEAMTEEEKFDYFKEKEKLKEHTEKKDQMLKGHLDLYKKGGKSKNPVFSSIKKTSTRKSTLRKSVSNSVERESMKRKSINANGFIVSGQIDQRNQNTKWAVNVSPNVLRHRMENAGATDKDIEALLASESDML